MDFSSNSFRVGVGSPAGLELTSAPPRTVCAVSGIIDRSVLLESQLTALEAMVENFRELPCLAGSRLGRTNKRVHHIDTGDSAPIKQRSYPMSPYRMEQLNKELEQMLSLSVIAPSGSSWSSPVLLLKKSSGELRFCFDGRRLNAMTRKDAYLLPLVYQILAKLSGAQFLSSIDLKAADTTRFGVCSKDCVRCSRAWPFRVQCHAFWSDKCSSTTATSYGLSIGTRVGAICLRLSR